MKQSFLIGGGYDPKLFVLNPDGWCINYEGDVPEDANDDSMCRAYPDDEEYKGVDETPEPTTYTTVIENNETTYTVQKEVLTDDEGTGKQKKEESSEFNEDETTWHASILPTAQKDSSTSDDAEEESSGYSRSDPVDDSTSEIISETKEENEKSSSGNTSTSTIAITNSYTTTVYVDTHDLKDCSTKTQNDDNGSGGRVKVTITCRVTLSGSNNYSQLS